MYHQYLKVAWPFIFTSIIAYVAAGFFFFFSKTTWIRWNELHFQKMFEWAKEQIIKNQFNLNEI